MKKRTKRDLSIFFGAISLILSVVFVNSQMGRAGNRAQFEELLLTLQQQRIDKGDLILEWKHMRETKGKPRTGGTFSEDLLAYDGKEINIVGFQTPEAEFRDVKEFLMLPIPLECYFCSMPPPKDVMLIRLREGETTRIFIEPVIVGGILKVNQGPDQKFFYELTEARMGGSLDGGPLTKKRLELQHMLGGDLHPDEELLEPTQEPRLVDPGKTD